MKQVFLFIVAAAVCINCTTSKERIPPVVAMEKPLSKIIIYQLLPRLFGNKLTVNKPYGSNEENGVGKFNDIDAIALKAIHELGITHIWYTGIIEHATLSDYSKFGAPADDADIVKGRAGSPYAIKDYYDVAPDLAVDVSNRMREFEQLAERTHSIGMKVLIDFVPNHVARSYHSDAKPDGVVDLGTTDDKSKAFSPQNNFYYLPGQSFQVPKDNKSLEIYGIVKDGRYYETPAKATGNDQFTASPGINDWYETVKLNYGIDIQNQRTTYFDPVPDTWNKMRDILLFWTGKKVDGFRCDMAEMVPVEFWAWVIPQVKLVNPDIIFIAEIYDPAQYNIYIEKGKFNYLYDKVQLYDTLRLAMKGERKATDIGNVQNSLSHINNRLLHFLENHDEQRIASKYFAGDPWKAVAAMVVTATVDQGAVMMYIGQEVGEPAIGAAGFQGDDGRTTIFDYWGVPEHQKWMNNGSFNGDSLTADQKKLRQFYVDLLNLAASNDAITNGKYADVTAANITAGNFNERVFAYVRYTDDERLLIISNFNDEDQLIKVQLPGDLVQQLGMKMGTKYTVEDLLWRELKVAFDEQFLVEFKIKANSSYVLKILK